MLNSLTLLSRSIAPILATGILLGCFPLPGLAAQQLSTDRQAGAAAVTVENCKTWLYQLASEEFGGRGTGQEGYRLAAEYVSAHFKALGMEALGEDGSYYQNVPWQQIQIAKAEMRFAIDGETFLTVAPERMSGRVSTSAEANGNVVLLNVEIPEGRGRRQIQGVEQLEEANLEGKVVIAVVRSDRNGLSSPPHLLAALYRGKKRQR